MPRRFKSACLLSLLTLVVFPLMASAGLGTSTGEEIDFWATRSVIYAEVVEVERLSSKDYFHGSHRLQVRPKATLTGNFDSARLPNLELGGWFGGFDCTCLMPPAKGRHIVAVIRKKGGEYFIESSILTFMPRGAGVVEVKDFSDPLVAEILGNVQAIRRKFPF